jgi:iron complex outermembrane receptor protein
LIQINSRLFCACIGVLLCCHAFAQNLITIKGKIRDKKTNEPLIGVAVNVKGTTNGATTDFDGEFTLRTSQPLPLILLVRYVGYENQEINVGSNAKPIDIKLAENTKILKDVEIRDTRITEKQKQQPLSVETMDAIAIKETPAANFYEGLAHLKGVDLTSASIGFKIINTRGFNSTSPVRSLQLIDGVDNQAPGLNFSLGNFLGASELDLQRVDLVVGASSAYYGPNAFNGVINMQTKSPFLFPGLSAQVKVGERNLLETSVRWAQVFKNKKGEDKFAYKFNAFMMRARDWEARNYDPTIQSPTDQTNPGGYDAVNRYGDEYTDRILYTPPVNLPSIGRGYYLRDGYNEEDLVDYNTRNLLLSGALHYKFYKDHEIVYTSHYATGTTIYQGDNRFSLRDIKFYQNKLEVRKEGKYFIRADATQEDAGKSIDAYSTAIILQNIAKSNTEWGKNYNDYLSARLSPLVASWYFENVNGKGLKLDERFPPGTNDRINFIEAYWRQNFGDTLSKIHNEARERANNDPTINNTGLPRFDPNTARFDSAVNSITTRTKREGGSMFFDQSALYHVAGEYKFTINKVADFTIGGNYRLYAPFSQGSIFLDTAANQRIYNREFGAYMGVEKKVLKEKLKISVTNRVDKNENFNWLWSPAATGVFTHKAHVFRVSLSSAIRNPTLTDQYINLNVGRATLLGNLQGFDSLVYITSLIDAFNNGRQNLQYFNVAPIRPEKVKTIEFGYRSTLWDKVFVDASYYHSWYTDFIGYKIGARVVWYETALFPTSVDVYRVATNSESEVQTQGFTIGVQYFWQKWLGFNANYSWNRLIRANEADSIIPAFNTPEHKYNLGISGRDITTQLGELALRHWGYGINYKWQTGFMFEGSPQFTGEVPAYGMLDVQVNKNFPVYRCTIKAGATNALNNRVFQVYGGPVVGRMLYLSLLFELNARQ